MQIRNPQQTWNWIKERIRPEWKTAFFSAALIGLLVHMPIMLRDIPNHDGLDSIYFDQNMITSGRWFLTVACGVSSFFTLPWVIGLLAVFYLALTSVALTEFLEIRGKGCIVLAGGLLVVFPSIASTFAYVFTMDGYMLALLLAVLSVLLTARLKRGFLWGALCLAFSMGIYQAYLSFAVILCIYAILMLAMEDRPLKEKLRAGCRYPAMGVLGVGAYYVILRILLLLEGKELASYQGIDGMARTAGGGLPAILKALYRDFFTFTLRGNILWNNLFSEAAMAALAGLALWTLVRLAAERKWWKSPWFYGILVLLAAGLPVAANLILIVSPEVTYHLLMRYQWVLFLILMLAFVNRFGKKTAWAEWALLAAAAVLLGNYVVSDHIAYANLSKRYEKTYAYCVRLLDRIEQTEGYYQGIPIAMIGVVGDEEFPVTDITGKVTAGMIGMSGDSLLYRGDNYELFIRHYLGATLNVLPAEAMEEAYYQPFYREMGSFPAKDSIRIVDGIMYIKTENVE